MTHWLKVLLLYLSGAILLLIVLLVLSNVFFRYFLHIGLGWAEEAARFLQIALTFTAAAAAVKQWGHFQLLIVTQWVPHRFHRMIQGFAVLVVLTMSAILVRYGIDIARLSWFQTSPTMEWSMGYLYLVVPVSGALMFVFALEHFVNILRGKALPAQGIAHPPPQPAHSPSTLDDKRQEQWL